MQSEGESASSGSLPIVVQIGFAGLRHMLPTAAHPNANAMEDIETLACTHLTKVLQSLPQDLKLSSHHFLCGLSQIAIGGDTVFSRACQSIGITQRILLPQHREDYLNAVGSDNAADFTPAEQHVARALLASPNIIEESVVSSASTRRERFEDVNLELMEQSDLLICLTRVDATGKAGGTRDVLDRASLRGHPTLEMRLDVRGSAPTFENLWYNREKFHAPEVPKELRDARIRRESSEPGHTSVAQYASALKSYTSVQAKWRRKGFKAAAVVIIGTHLAATVFAVIALKIHVEHSEGPLPPAAILMRWLLGIEIGLLLAGFGVHHFLHQTRSARIWALSRLLAEMARSVAALAQVHTPLAYLFRLPFPASIRAVVRTINVLHLRSTMAARGQPWIPKRDAYVQQRLRNNGQLNYYERSLTRAQSLQKYAQRSFIGCSLGAIVASGLKLYLAMHPVTLLVGNYELILAVLGALAVVLPVAAVGAMSLAASFDLEARENTYSETLESLKTLVLHLEQATTEREFTRLALAAEERLLGETADWAGRRAYTGVS
ncbi:MAG: hypothetical protein ABJB74_23390 [Gemmatimonas sp.]